MQLLLAVVVLYIMVMLHVVWWNPATRLVARQHKEAYNVSIIAFGFKRFDY